jgi:hypothetical protein
VSISLSDSKVHHGDCECVLFYRTQSVGDSTEPCESLKVETIVKDEDVPWNRINGNVLLNSNLPGRKTVAIGSTFRSVGEEKISAIFHIDGHQSQVYH